MLLCNLVYFLLRVIDTSQTERTTFEYNGMDQRDKLAADLLQIESHIKLCQTLIKESARPDIPHKSFVEKTHAFIIQLKSLLNAFNENCCKEIEAINSQFSNLEFIQIKSNHTISRDPG